MKIAVLIPSDEYRGYAGARIRYGRITPLLVAAGISMELHDVADFDPLTSNPDVLIISKCHDSRALLAAALLGDRGCVVGVDLFDDYFSQWEDSRLARFRNWLSQLTALCDFATCSTKAMAEVVKRYRSDLPVHVMNDPAGEADFSTLPELLSRKRAEVLASRRMTIAWFGVGDNPNFPIGLYDLAAYSGCLSELARHGLDVTLRVMTNARALTAKGLAQIGQLPVRTQVSEWSEEAEKDLLSEAFAAFLPVNEQSFSRAKSLNRAVTALTAGCQVLSVGYPLYEQLGSLVYRDGQSLINDLVADTLKLSPGRMRSFHKAMQNFASAETEASRLADFLRSVKAGVRDEGPIALVHGVATNGAAHKMARAANGLSIATPYCTTPLGFDVIFRGAGARLTMLVSDKAKNRIRRADLDVSPPVTVDGKKFVIVGGASESGEVIAGDLRDWKEADLPFQLATYRAVLAEIETRLRDVFGPCRVIVSESAQLPFSLAA